ncbi:hypothetical protein OIV83_000869 [Microbotryomycetes sp. JL201]|nr:hypothetical protein OIV83_000869 [Microbotryomycetes sp. JL201]
MALKRELQVWGQALEAYNEGDLDASLSLFRDIADSSKVLYNVAAILAQQGDYSQAIVFCERANELDPFLAVAYFLAGISSYRIERFRQAERCFDKAFINLRGNAIIDYEQLGLKFRLFACEVLFNRALAFIEQGSLEEASIDLGEAAARKAEPQHAKIEEALGKLGSGHQKHELYTMPEGLLFRPAEVKMKNLETRDYLGKPKLIAAASLDDAHTELGSSTRQRPKLSKEKSDQSPRGARPRRSNTSGARLETTFVGVAKPLTQPGNTLFVSNQDDDHQTQILSTRLGRTQTVGAFSAPSLPHAAESELDERQRQVGIAAMSSSRTLGMQSSAKEPDHSMYAGAHFVNEYLREEPESFSPVRPLVPSRLERSRTTSEKARVASTASETSSPPLLSRVATWARHRANASLTSMSSQSKNAENENAHTSISPSSQPLAQPGSDRPRCDSLNLITEHLASLLSTPETSFGPGSSPSHGIALPNEPMSNEAQAKIRVKVGYQDQIRALIVSSNLSLVNFRRRLQTKFCLEFEPSLKYKDPDGVIVSLVDQEDWECVLEEVAANGKLEVSIDG